MSDSRRHGVRGSASRNIESHGVACQFASETRMETSHRPRAIVTGASTGIGYELAKCCAENGFDLVIAADEKAIERAAGELRGLGASVTAVEADLARTEGVDKLMVAIRGLSRPVDALLANAGRGLGRAFLDQDW